MTLSFNHDNPEVEILPSFRAPARMTLELNKIIVLKLGMVSTGPVDVNRIAEIRSIHSYIELVYTSSSPSKETGCKTLHKADWPLKISEPYLHVCIFDT
jgi:hypothetical protein